jgi:hypothetical protein
MIGVVTAGRVRQDLHARIQMIEKRFRFSIERTRVDRDCDHLSSGRGSERPSSRRTIVLPVPMMRREENSFPANVNLSVIYKEFSRKAH